MEKSKRSKRNELILLMVSLVSIMLFIFATKVTAQPKQAIYKIGQLIAISGPASFYWTEWGAEGEVGSWLERFVNTKMGGIRGVPIKIISYDDKSKPEDGVLGFKKLVGEDKVIGIVGPGLVSTARAIIPHIRERGGPLTIAQTGGFEAPTDLPYFKSCPTEADHITALFTWMKRKSWTKVGLVADNTGTGEVAIRTLGEFVLKHNMQMVNVERFERTDVDLTSQFKRMEIKKPDVIVLWTTGGQAVLGAKTVQSLGIKIPLVLSAGNCSKPLLKLMKDIHIDNVYVIAVRPSVWKQLPGDEPARKIMEWLSRASTAMTGKPVADIVGFAPPDFFDAYAVMFSALDAVGTDAKAMQSWIEKSGKNWSGAMGGIEYGPNQHGTDTETLDQCTVIGRIVGPQARIEFLPEGYVKALPRYNETIPFLKKMMEVKF